MWQQYEYLEHLVKIAKAKTLLKLEVESVLLYTYILYNAREAFPTGYNFL